MKIELKDSERYGLMRTVNGYINIQSEVVFGKLEINHSRKMVDSLSYEGSEFQVHTGFDQLILSFGEESHIFVTTTNNGDAVGHNGWRHAAHQIGLDLTGKEIVKDASRLAVVNGDLNNVSDTILDHIHKLVDISYISMKETDKSTSLRNKFSKVSCGTASPMPA